MLQVIIKKSRQTKSSVKKRIWRSDQGRWSKWLRGDKCPTGARCSLNAGYQTMDSINILSCKAMSIATVMTVTALRITNIYEASDTLSTPSNATYDTAVITLFGS